MISSYYFCTINEFLPKLQCKMNQPNFSLSEFLIFLRSLPLNYQLDKGPFKENGKKYFLLLDEQTPIFRLYLSREAIEIIILHQPRATLKIQTANLCYAQVSHLYRKVSLSNFPVNIYRLDFSLNFYMLGNRPETTGYKVSTASFEILKMLNRFYPNSQEILTEKLICIDAYSHQQKINIYKSIANEVRLIHILAQQKGISRVYIHETKDGELKYNDSLSINGFCWLSPWVLEALMNLSYFELDCTFAILSPYVTCIPQLIMKNVSLPIGFIAGPEESSELYRLLYTELQNVLGKNDRLHELPILSDQGQGLIKFCKDNNLNQFYCIRHIINLIGAKSFFGKLVRKLLLSQKEPEFVCNHNYVIQTLNGYFQVNKNIPDKVLKYCFVCIQEDKIIADPNVDDALLNKTVLFNRAYIASSSNHAEGFHRQLKSIAKLNLGIEYNLEKLIEQINKRYDKYRTGESAQKMCERLKNEMLEKQKRYSISPVEECDCGSTFHKEMMLECEIPCVHTINQETKLSIELPQLDERKFINCQNFKPVRSPLTGTLKFTNKDKELIDEGEDKAYEEINEAIIRNRNFISFYNPALVKNELEDIVRCSTIDALKLGMDEANIDDFIKFYMMDYLLNGCDIESFIKNKEINLGRYFALYKVK